MSFHLYLSSMDSDRYASIVVEAVNSSKVLGWLASSPLLRSSNGETALGVAVCGVEVRTGESASAMILVDELEPWIPAHEAVGWAMDGSATDMEGTLVK